MDFAFFLLKLDSKLQIPKEFSEESWVNFPPRSAVRYSRPSLQTECLCCRSSPWPSAQSACPDTACVSAKGRAGRQATAAAKDVGNSLGALLTFGTV